MAYGQDCVPAVVAPSKSKPSDTDDADIDRFEEGMVYLLRLIF